MKLLVIGAGMMGSAAAYDMARQPAVAAVTLADADLSQARAAAARVNKLLGKTNAGKPKVRAVRLDAGNERAASQLMSGHAATLSAVPYFFNLGLCQAAIAARCHFADLGGNNTVVRDEYALSAQAAKRGVSIAPDCGLSPGMASVLAGELVRRIESEENEKLSGRGVRAAKIDALKIYVGGLPKKPQPPFSYQLVFSVEGLINEYAEPAKILRKGKITTIEPLTELEPFAMPGFPALDAFHTSGGTSTLPETFKGRVGECFEKTLRYPGHFATVRSLYELGFFSKTKVKAGAFSVSPREITARLFMDKLSGAEPDVCIMRIEAHRRGKVTSFSMVDYFDPRTGMTAMMRTTAWPAAIVTMMMASGVITKRGGIHQETDVPGSLFLDEMARRGVNIRYAARPS